jgi:hypothetical protein
MKKVAATRGHSPSFEEAFLFAISGWGAAEMNSWLQRAGVLANFDGFLLRLSHEMRLQAQNTHISEAVKKILQKKTRESARLGLARPCREISPPKRRMRRVNTFGCHPERSGAIRLRIVPRSRGTPDLLAAPSPLWGVL